MLLAGLGTVLGAVGLVFLSLGAWPVAGFCGLELLLVWGALALHRRAGRRRETVRLGADALVVTRIDPNGRRAVWRFEPGWLRVEVEPRRDGDDRLVLASHGRRLAIGRFLTPAERRDFASRLRRALALWRTAPAGLGA